MTTGALIFAFNNDLTDYVRMATWSAQRIRRYLNIPVAIVTNSTDPGISDHFDHVIHAQAQAGGTRYFEDYSASVEWHNANRVSAYDITPWERTLVLDADYVVDSTDLKIVLESQRPFLCFRSAHDITKDWNPLLPRFGRYNFPMWWATVMVFDRNPLSQDIFDIMCMVQQHWQHYRDLYGIDQSNYRNDYALSIALGVVSGHTLQFDAIPWSMATVMPDAALARQDHEWVINYTDPRNRPYFTTIRNMDFHAMGKQHLEAVIATS